MSSSKEIRNSINTLLTQMSDIAGHKDGWSSTRRAGFDSRQRDVEIFEADLARVEAMESRATADREADSLRFNRSPRPGAVDGGLNPELPVAEKRQKVSKAFQDYALRGFGGMSQEHRAMLTTSDTTGGAFIPQMFDSVLTTALKFYGPTAQLVRQKVTNNNGAPLKIALTNDTTNGLTLLPTEGTSGPVETDPAVQSRTVGVDTVSGGLVLVSFQEIDDSSFDLDTFLRERFAIRYARGLETAVTLGKDSSGTTLPNQGAGGLNSIAVVSGTTSALSAGIGWDDLTTCFSALDPAYSNVSKAKWFMNSATRGYLVGLKDGFGRPYFTPDPSADGPFEKLLGFDVVVNQALPSMGASAVPILFGDPESAYMLRTDGAPSILRLNERYADTLQVGFYLWSRIGGASLVATSAPVPLASVKQASS